MKKTTKLILVLTLVVIFTLAMLAFAACKQPETPNPSGNGGTSQSGDNTNQGGNNNPNQGNDNPTKPTVTVNSNGGTVNGDFTVNNDGYITPPTSQPTKAGYVFDGYFKDAECTIAWNFETDKVTVDITVTIYIRWKPQGGDTPITKPTVTVNTNGGTFDSNITVNEDNTITEPSTIPTKPNYKFDGWYKDEDCTIKWNFETDTVTVNITIYIKWIRVYDVTFNTNNGSAVSPIEADENTTISKPTDPTRDGYTFDAWYKDSDCTTPWNFETDKVTKDTTLFARWKEVILIQGVQYTLNGDGESYAVCGTSNLTDTVIVIPSTCNDKPVTVIGEAAFIGCNNITSITIPNSVTLISAGAFSGCSSLESITLPFVGESIKTSKDRKQYPFGYIFGTSSYVNGVATTQEYYEIGTFPYTKASTKYYIPSSLKSVIITGGNILYGAFYGCGKLISITVPDDITSIGDYAFFRCSNLTSIIIPDSVTSIGERAFSNCSSLLDITIPDKVTSIGKTAFYSCDSLTSLTIPDNVTSIGDYAFLLCRSLETIYWNATACTTAGSYSGYIFKNCSKLTSVVIGDNVTTIPSYAFYNCDKLVSITIPNSLKTIGSWVFYNCSSLTSITIPENMTSIGSYAFFGCNSLTSITIPDSVTYVGSGAFQNCTSLTSLTFPNNMATVSEQVIYGCSGITKITIPGCVTKIEYRTFKNCSSLAEIKFDGTILQWRAVTKGLDWNVNILTVKVICTDGESYFMNNIEVYTNGGTVNGDFTVNDDGTLTPPSTEPSKEGFTFDGWYKDSDCTTPWNFATDIVTSDTTLYAKWEKVISKYTVTFETNGGSEIASLTDIVENSTITAPTNPAKDSYKFGGWYKDSTLQNPWDFSADSIVNNTILYAKWIAAFTVTFESNGGSEVEPLYEVESGATIAAPINPTKEDVVFECWCSDARLQNIWNFENNTITQDIKLYARWRDSIEWTSGLSYIYNYQDNTYHLTGTGFATDSQIRIPSLYQGLPVSVIRYDAFLNNSSITSVIIPKSVKTIGDSAFAGCTNLFDVTISEGVWYIGASAFKDCGYLSEIEIPSSVTSLGAGVFSGCGSLQSITLSSLYTFSPYPFGYIFGENKYTNGVATEQSYEDYSGNTKYATYYIPASLKNVTILRGNIPNDTFYKCGNIETVKIPEGATTIGTSAFDRCSNLKSVNIPDGVTTIGAYAFDNCTSLTNITLPNSVTSIGKSAFYNCEKLTSIIIPEKVTTIGDSLLRYCDELSSVTIGKNITYISSYAFASSKKLTYITFEGTVEEWGKIEKSYYWKSLSSLKKVICSDGEVAL